MGRGGTNSLVSMMHRATLETKVWVVGGEHVLSVRNYTGGAVLEVFVDAQKVKATTSMSQKFERDLGEICGQPAHVLVTLIGGSAYTYAVTMGGEPVVDVASQPWDEAAAWFVDMPRRVGVPEARLGSAEAGDAAELVGKALYKVVVSTESGEVQSESWRRYSEFDDLYTLIYSAYSGGHLASNIPLLPPKTWTVRTDSAFLAERQRLLDAWLQGLFGVPRMAVNPDLLLFLGLMGSGPSVCSLLT